MGEMCGRYVFRCERDDLFIMPFVSQFYYLTDIYSLQRLLQSGSDITESCLPCRDRTRPIYGRKSTELSMQQYGIAQGRAFATRFCPC